MHRLDENGGALGFERRVDGLDDLRRHALLGLQTAGIDFDDARQLGDADHRLPRQIGDMRSADERDDMVFTMRIELDIAQHDDVVIAFNLIEGAR